MGEPWIRVHANLAGKPIVWRAVETLHVSQHEAIGLLVQFWGSVSQHATNGQVADLPDAQLEVWAGWRGKRGRFAAFIRATHLDPDGRVNEWDEYAGALEARRVRDRKRKQNERMSHGQSERQSRGSHADSPQDIPFMSAPTKRNDTKREIDEEAREPEVDGSAIGEPGLTALYLTIWANGAISEQWGEQPSPLTPSGSHTLAERLRELGAPWQVARDSIYRQCRGSALVRPPRSVNYFENGIREDLEREATKLAQAASGERAPPIQQKPGIAARTFASTLRAIEDIP